jgi:hypothetical protein
MKRLRKNEIKYNHKIKPTQKRAAYIVVSTQVRIMTIKSEQYMTALEKLLTSDSKKVPKRI